MEFVVEDIGERVKIDKEFKLKEFADSFIPSFCVTVYKYQRAKIDKQYNIYDLNWLDKLQLYTSLSRTTRLQNIHLDTKKLIKKIYRVRVPISRPVQRKTKSVCQW